VKVQTPTGETVVVRRQWLPWRQKSRDVDPSDLDLPGDIVGDDPSGLVITLVLLVLILLAPFVFVIFFAVAEFLLLVALLPMFVAARLGWAMTWTVMVKRDGTLQGTRKVTGWTESGVLIHDLAAAYERGEDPVGVSP